MKTRVMTSLMMAALLALLVLLPGCVTKARYDELRASRDALAHQNSEFTTQNRRMAAVGAMMGYALELQDMELAKLSATEADLRAELEEEILEGDIRVAMMRDGLHVSLSNAVLFPVCSAELGEAGREITLKLVDDFQRLQAQIVFIGYTDNLPIRGRLAREYPSNWELAGARSAAVVRLFQSAGIDPGRLLVASLGANDPVASHDTAEGRAQTRRIDGRLRPVRR